ncbi:cohesin domain-containing protein [Natrarchaeobaculum aegyptiacum]|uniref:Cohesin domain-containing protein n=1 Tax=Natrarchaeobaculum aegyptiacum TaxID=745377 RepID=A0A2Z2HXC4_9EURY|nr:cohesin domain-containing protein [Natrarchaeobaculum aegyptiacum]ARS91533.1 hypothetical protein B1756_18610 [Natrarchaeobaculum aegyptiacum]
MQANSHSRRTRLLLVALVVLGCALAVFVAVPGAVIAGDGTSLLEFEESEHAVDSGETITLEVVAYDHGDSSGDGLASLSFDVDYDPDVLIASEVEHESMLGDDDDVELVTDAEIDEDEGRVTVEQERDPVGDGGTGYEAAATITFDVPDDVGSTSTTVDLTNAQAYRPSDWPVYPISRDATIHVDGGAEDELDDADDDGGPQGVTFADDLEGDDESGSGSEADQVTDDDTDDATPPADGGSGDESASDDDGETASSDESATDAVPGFAAFGAATGVVGALAMWLRGRRP